MHKLGFDWVLKTVGVTRQQFATLRSSVIQHLAYRIGDKDYVIESTAQIAVQQLLTLLPDMQRNLVKAVAEAVPGIGESIYIEADDRKYSLTVTRVKGPTLATVYLLFSR